MDDSTKIILIAVALFVAACWVFYKERIMPKIEEDVRNFAMEDSQDEEVI